MIQCSSCEEKKHPNQLLTFRSCKHSCICQECYFKDRMRHFYSFTYQNSNKKLPSILCANCKEETFYMVGGITKKIVEQIVDSKEQQNFYTNLHRYFRSLRIGYIDYNGIHHTILGLYREFVGKNSRAIFLTVNQCESLLKIAQEKNIFEKDSRTGRYILDKSYMLRNVLVALCIHPWNVDKQLGFHGICYHGNLGEEPDLADAFNLLHRNFCHFLEDSFF